MCSSDLALEVRFVSSLVVLRPRHAVDAIRERLLAGEDVGDLPGPPAALLVWRQAERVFHRRADPLEAAWIEAARLDRGIRFDALCELAARDIALDRDAGSVPAASPPDPAGEVLAKLRCWLRDSLLVDTRVRG